MTLHQTAAGRLQEAEQRYTPSRRDLVTVLEAVGRPVAIPEVLERLPGSPQSSVYRNLAVLEQAGVVRRVLGIDDFARYELAEDLTEHHHHLVCRTCGDVADVPATGRFERTLDRVVAEAVADTGFVPEGHRLDLVGRCAACVSAARG